MIEELGNYSQDMVILCTKRDGSGWNGRYWVQIVCSTQTMMILDSKERGMNANK